MIVFLVHLSHAISDCHVSFYRALQEQLQIQKQIQTVVKSSLLLPAIGFYPSV